MDKKARLDADCSSDRKKKPFPKSEKGPRSTKGSGGRRDVLVATSDKKKGGVSRPRAGKKCWITGLKTTTADVDHPGDLTILLSYQFLAWLTTIKQQIPYLPL